MQCGTLGYRPAGTCFGSSSRRHMSVTFRVWNAVISLSTAELKSTMRDGDQGNRGVRNQEWSGVERNGAERSGIRIIRIKIKEKMRYHHSTPYQQSMSSWTNGAPSVFGLVVGAQQEGQFASECWGVCDRSPLRDRNHCLPPVGVGVCHQSRYRQHFPKYCVPLRILPIES